MNSESETTGMSAEIDASESDEDAAGTLPLADADRSKSVTT